MSFQQAQPPQHGRVNKTAASKQSSQSTGGGSQSPEIDSNSSDDSDSAFEAGPEDNQILSAYRHLLSRRVDLVGDYAGDELFLIEGDSMLLRCFDDDKLDFQHGLQLLHAVYNVEYFLHNLVKRKCNFNIVFFQSNRECCLPLNSDTADRSKYFLARACIIRHLKANLQRSHPRISVDIFESWQSVDFLEYLQRLSPYFFMAHDGAAAVDWKSQHLSENADTVEPNVQRLALREMILFFIAHGYNAALVNGLEWRDTKVMTMVLEARHRWTRSTLPQRRSITYSKVPSIDVSSETEKFKNMSLTERQSVIALTVCKLFDTDIPELTAEVKVSLCATLLLHQALLMNMPLTARRLPIADGNEEAKIFLSAASRVAESIVNTASWRANGAKCDIADLFDGRLFLQIAAVKPKVTSSVRTTFETLLQAVQEGFGSNAVKAAGELESTETYTNGSTSVDTPGKSQDVAVLPFSNRVFDKHLDSVRIQVDAAVEGKRSLASRKVFQEVSHWHNAKRPLVHKGPQPVDSKQAFWAAKRNQLFMAEMAAYAASLTNSVGKSLEPETIIVGVPRQSKIKSGTESPADSEVSDSGTSTSSKSRPVQKKAGGGKTAAKNAGKQAMLNQIAAAKAKKDESANDKIASSWRVVCKGFEAELDPRSRYRKCRDYLINLQPSWKEAIGGEVELYLVNCLLVYWIEASRIQEKSKRIQVVALIWSHLRSISQSGSLPQTVAKCLQLTVETLGLPPLPEILATAFDRKLAFTFVLPTKTADLSVDVASKEFQLLQCGPYLERSFDSKPDPRVDFQPDAWQRKVLDSIDLDQSVMAVAPTSAGKTFISFYAMRKVLEADDDGVLVYVAPTKALVNQIAAEIQARYSKKFKYGGKSVWAIHTRDYRINNPNGCQVLVTVPHVLQIMLLAPSNANSWSSRVKRIIFDEIHSIGQAEDGVVWEQLLLMAPCPIIALSATVGNPQEFSDWLATTQTAIGKELITVQHPYRYSDLRKYYYVPPKRFAFRGIPDKSSFGSLGLDGLTGFNFIHPVAGLVDKSRGIPEDLALEPRDCLILWKAMVKVQNGKHFVPSTLDPEKSLPTVSRKVDILKWEKALKEVLKIWMEDATSPYDALLRELEQSFRDDSREALYGTQSTQAVTPAESDVNAESLTKSTLPMLCRLQEQDALPAILFNYDRHQCEKMCRAVVEQLQSSELKQRKSGPKWEKTLEEFEDWKQLKAKANSRIAKTVVKKTKKSKDDDDEEKTTKFDMQRDAAGSDDTKWESFDPDGPVSGYHFADHTRIQASEIAIFVRQLRRREIQPWLIEALARGIGVHHAGMNRKYRQVVEILFRKRFLTVIIATGTLALGINMPCKTVVFSGDSVFLTALNYRQCAGRAGRRGFDLLGNVVFQGVSREKVCRLISSRLPDLNGHFPITTTLVLRLFTLLHESNNSKYAVSAINALLSQPRLYMGGASFKDQTMHHLRFSIEYLRRQQLLGSDGAPLNFAGLVSHLYFTENSSFAFHALLKEGYFHELCSNIGNNEKDTLETLMLVLSHLFNRISCRQADSEYREKVVKPSSSIVFLPPMPRLASEILASHNQETLRVYKAYVKTFVDQHLDENDSSLPLTGMMIGTEDGSAPENLRTLAPTHVRSAFAALSGAGDDFDTIHDLCHTTRHGVFLEEAVIPHMDVYPEEMQVPLNAYLLDFFKHGDVMTIERANGVRRADIWFLLNDFSLVLATIITSLMNFMKLSEGSDMDMLEVMGRMDAHEEEEDDKMAIDQQSEVSGPSVADSGIVLADRTTKSAAPTKRQAQNADSWEDLAGDDDDADVDSTTEKELGSQAQAIEQELWDAQGDEGLRNILKAFQKLHAEFNVRFKAMWA